MINFVKQSEQEAKAQLQAKFNKADYDYSKCNYIDDFARISSFLSDEQAVLPYLKRLNDRLMVLAAMDNFQAKQQKERSRVQGSRSAEPGRRFQKHLGELEAHESEVKLQVYYQKHHKVLSGFLNSYLTNQGFNQGVGSLVSKGQQVSYTQGSAAKLPGFVEPAEFKSNLLRVGRHFKDPGVGVHHGEFTHQIHWFVLCEYMKDATNPFRNKPVALFKECGSATWSAGNSLCVWDFLFEGALPSRDFRHAESFNNYILLASDKEHPNNPSLWFLADLVMGRFAKRAREKGTI